MGRHPIHARDMTLAAFAATVYKPDGGCYTPGYFSRLERGWASAPMYVYLAVAHARELMLICCLRRLHISPDEALVRLTRG
jgi:hypothetical protein